MRKLTKAQERVWLRRVEKLVAEFRESVEVVRASGYIIEQPTIRAKAFESWVIQKLAGIQLTCELLATGKANKTL